MLPARKFICVIFSFAALMLCESCVLAQSPEPVPTVWQPERIAKEEADIRKAVTCLGASKSEIESQFPLPLRKSMGGYEFYVLGNARSKNYVVLCKAHGGFLYSLKVVKPDYSLDFDKNPAAVITLWPAKDNDGKQSENFRIPSPWIGLRPGKIKLVTLEQQREAVCACVDGFDTLTVDNVKAKLGDAEFMCEKGADDRYFGYWMGDKKHNALESPDWFGAEVVVFQESQGKIVSIEIAEVESCHKYR